MRGCLERSIQRNDRSCKVVSLLGSWGKKRAKGHEALGVDLFDQKQVSDVLGMLDTFKIATHLHDYQKLDSTKSFHIEYPLE